MQCYSNLEKGYWYTWTKQNCNMRMNTIKSINRKLILIIKSMILYSSNVCFFNNFLNRYLWNSFYQKRVLCLTCIYCYSTNKDRRNRHYETPKGPKKWKITRRSRCSCRQNSLEVDLPRYTTKDKQEERIGIHPCVDWFHLLYPCTGWIDGDVLYKFTRHGKWNTKPLEG